MSAPVFVFHPDYDIELPAGHRFPMAKFRLLHTYLIESGVAAPGDFYTPEAPSREILELAHTPEYVQAILHGELDRDAERRIGLPWSPALARRTHIAVGGTLLTARLALQHGLACNTAGGTHHAFSDAGAGFCLFNDLAVTARAMRREHPGLRVLIVDLDVHQGDGSAAILQNESAVFTFSMHCEKNFPARKQTSNRDVGLAPGTGDAEYMSVLRAELPALLRDFAPGLVLYDAGVDPHLEDPLGHLELSDAGLAERDRFVIESCRSAQIPTACVIGGGYGKDLQRLAERHAILHRTAREFFD
mgnify:CR=1 FL=1